MEMSTIADFQALSTEEIGEIFWDWYKDVHNIRPRWVDPSDREYMLGWIENEIQPETIAIRRTEWEEEKLWLEQQELKMKQELLEEEAERQAREWYDFEQSLCA